MAIDNYGETALLRAVQQRIVTSVSAFAEACEIEPDGRPSADVGDRLCIVSPNGIRQGPTHRTSGGVSDKIYSVKVTVLMRLPMYPPDRDDQLFLANLDSINSLLKEIEDVIDWEYTNVINVANTFITEQEGANQQGFIFPLIFQSIDPQPQAVGADYFLSKMGERRAGMQRAIIFGEARRIQSRT